mgnify:CR=1 FL=1
MEKDFSELLAHWRESIFSFQVRQWLEVIRNNTSIETVTIDLSLSDDSIWKRDQLRALMEAIGSLPKLTKLVCQQNLVGQPRRNAPTDALVHGIRKTHSLEHFELWGTAISEQGRGIVDNLVTVLKGCSELQTLKILGFHLTLPYVVMFTSLMQMPNMKDFALGNSSDGFLPVAQGLADNKNIEHLTLCYLDHIEDSICFGLVDALRYNTSLDTLSLLNTSPSNNSSGISDRSHDALIRMLEENMNLSELKTRGTPSADIQFYLKLNRAGRRHLFYNHELTRDDWIERVVSSRDDMDCSYYFLAMNPSVCVDAI